MKRYGIYKDSKLKIPEQKKIIKKLIVGDTHEEIKADTGRTPRCINRLSKKLKGHLAENIESLLSDLGASENRKVEIIAAMVHSCLDKKEQLRLMELLLEKQEKSIRRRKLKLDIFTITYTPPKDSDNAS